MVTHGKGGWTWEALYYHIPVFLRNFYLKELSLVMEREAKASKPEQTSGVTPPPYVKPSS